MTKTEEQELNREKEAMRLWRQTYNYECRAKTVDASVRTADKVVSEFLSTFKKII